MPTWLESLAAFASGVPAFGRTGSALRAASGSARQCCCISTIWAFCWELSADGEVLGFITPNAPASARADDFNSDTSGNRYWVGVDDGAFQSRLAKVDGDLVEVWRTDLGLREPTQMSVAATDGTFITVPGKSASGSTAATTRTIITYTSGGAVAWEYPRSSTVSITRAFAINGTHVEVKVGNYSTVFGVRSNLAGPSSPFAFGPLAWETRSVLLSSAFHWFVSSSSLNIGGASSIKLPAAWPASPMQWQNAPGFPAAYSIALDGQDYVYTSAYTATSQLNKFTQTATFPAYKSAVWTIDMGDEVGRNARIDTDADGYIYAGGEGGTLKKFDSDGNLVWSWASGITTGAGLRGVRVSSAGTILVCGYASPSWPIAATPA